MNRPSINPESGPNSYNLRIFLLLFAIIIFIMFIGIRIFNISILSHAYYRDLADNQHGSSQSITPTRGNIYLTALSGNPLLVATNVAKNMVYAVPHEITDKAGTA